MGGVGPKYAEYCGKFVAETEIDASRKRLFDDWVITRY